MNLLNRKAIVVPARLKSSCLMKLDARKAANAKTPAKLLRIKKALDARILCLKASPLRKSEKRNIK